MKKRRIFLLILLLTLFVSQLIIAQESSDVFFKKIDSLNNSNKSDEAIKFLDQRVSNLMPDTLNSEYVECLLRYGYAYYFMKQGKRAKKYYEIAVKIEKSVAGETVNLADAYMVLGLIDQNEGLKIEGIDYLCKSKKIYENLGYYNKAALNYARMASFFSFKIDKTPAIFFNTLAYRSLKKRKDYTSYDLALIERSMAISYMTVDNDSSEYYYEKAYKTISKSDDVSNDYLKALCAAGIAESSLGNGNYEKTQIYIPITSKLFIKTRGLESYQMGSLHTIHGELLMKLGQYDSAFYYANKALEIYNKYDESFNWDATCYLLMSDIEKSRGNYQKAIEYTHIAMYSNAVYAEMPENTNSILSPDSAFYSAVQHRKNIMNMAKLNYSIYNKTKDITELKKSCGDFVKYFDFIINAFYTNALSINGVDQKFNTYINEGLDYLFPIAQKIDELTNSNYYTNDLYNCFSVLKSGLFYNNNIDKGDNNLEKLELLNKKKETEKELEALNFEAQYKQKNIDSLDFIYKKIEKKYIEALQIKMQLNKFKGSDEKQIVRNNFTLENIYNNIEESTLIADYYYNDSCLYIFTVEKKQMNLTKVDVTDEFPKLIKKCNRIIKTGEKLNSPELTQLSSLILKPISNYLKNKKKLIFIPFANLSSFPVELLPYGENKFLAELMAVSYHFSTAILFGKKEEKQEAIYKFLAYAPEFSKEKAQDCAMRSVLFADSSFYRTNLIEQNSNKVAPLPYAVEEVKKIGDIFKKQGFAYKIFKGSEATKTNFKQNISKSKIIHIASHGYASSSNPHLSGIFFFNNSNKSDNGYLFMSELSEVKIDADLVVISACQSGKGKEHSYGGSISLPSSFIAAGAENVIASLWKVNDKKTEELMLSFYTHLLNENMSYSKALQLAKLDCIKKGFLPLDWAGFILIGK